MEPRIEHTNIVIERRKHLMKRMLDGESPHYASSEIPLTMNYLRASHFGPTALVTTLAFLFSRHYFTPLNSLLVAITIFSGQLIVGWTNDLVDFHTDTQQQRADKPLVAGTLSIKSLRLATLIDLPICVALSLFGPLGFRSGMVHLLGVGCGISYNFYLKRTIFSPLPYAIAFAALPVVPRITMNKPIALWMILTGALFGVVAHFANVLKDYESDREIGIKGLPQRLPRQINVLICIMLLVVITFLIGVGKPSIAPYLGAVMVAGAALIVYKPAKLAFPIIMALALISVLAVAL